MSALEAWQRAGRAGGPGWDRVLTELHQQGVEAWPAVDLGLERFVAHVAAVTPQALTLEAAARLSGEGLALCAGCLQGDPAAAGIFEAVFLAPLSRVLRKLDGGADVEGDVLQRLRTQFFAPARGRSSFLAYSGAGALGVWLKVVAVREAQKLRRGGVQQHAVADAPLADMPAPEADPELRFMKLQHRAHFKEAFQEALASLEKRERSVLRMSVVEGLSVDDIAKVYDVHRATAARWVSGARERLVQACRARLASRLAVGASELDEVMGEVQSHLSISLGHLSISPPGPRGGSGSG